MLVGARRWTLLLGIVLLARHEAVLGQQAPPAMPSVQNIPAALAPDLAAPPQAQPIPAAAVDEKAGLEARVAELERAMRQAEEKQAGAKYVEAGTTGPVADQPTTFPLAPVSDWTDGIVIHDAADSVVLRITGQIQLDYRDFLNPADQTDIDTFLVRRARLGIEATILNYYEFRLLPDFGSTAPSITDAYLNVHYVNEIQFELGKFKQPISYEQLILDRYVPTMERSMIDQMVPARDVGAMIHGEQLMNGRLDYAVSVSNGETNGNTDTNNSKDVDARIALRPFGEPQGAGLLHGLEFGISGGTGVEDEAVSPSTLKTPATVPWFAYKSGVLADGLRTRLSPELVYFYHSLGIAAQYYREEQKLQASAASPTTNVGTDGFYVMTTYLLTGEQRVEYTQQIAPLRPFNPRCAVCSPGAWEVVFRISRLDLDRAVFATGTANLADSTKYSSGATESTWGVNWYWNKWVRAQLDWEHAWFDAPVALGTGSSLYLNRQDTLYARFQFIF
jgi:phosphate-selective porin OprO/OprP